MENVIAVSQPSRMGRSVAAVAAGLATIVVTHTAADAVLHASGVKDGLFALAAGHRVVLSVLGAYVTARLAPARPRKHALVLGAIGLALSTLGVVARLASGPELGPLWYPVLLVLVTIPCCLAGAALHRAHGEENPS